MRLVTVTVVMPAPEDYDPAAATLSDAALDKLLLEPLWRVACFVGIEDGVTETALRLGANPPSWSDFVAAASGARQECGEPVSAEEDRSLPADIDDGVDVDGHLIARTTPRPT